MDQKMRVLYDEHKDKIALIRHFIDYATNEEGWNIPANDLTAALGGYTGIDLFVYEEELEAEEAALKVQTLLNSLKEQ